MRTLESGLTLKLTNVACFSVIAWVILNRAG